MPLTLVLSVGLDSSLLGTRTLVLQSAGYMVVSALSIKEAVDRFLAGDFDLVLLGHPIPTKDRERLTCLIRASGSLTPVVSIAESSGQYDAFADATLENDPEKLLIGIKEVLDKTARISATGTATGGDKQEVTAALGRKPPIPSGDYQRREQKTRATKERSTPFVHAGGGG